MKKIQREFDMLSKEEREKALKDIIAYYVTEREEEIDIISANEILDTFLQDVAPIVYNKAVEDVRKIFKRQGEDFDFELAVLKK